MIKAVYLKLLSRDTSDALILILKSSIDFGFKPFADLLIICLAKIEIIKCLILGSEIKHEIIDGLTKAFLDMQVNLMAIENLSSLYDHTMSQACAECIESVILKLLDLVILYHESKEVFFKDFAEIRASLEIFDSDLLHYFQNIKSSSNLTRCSTNTIPSSKKLKKRRRVSFINPKNKPRSNNIFIITKINKREEEDLSTLRQTSSWVSNKSKRQENVPAFSFRILDEEEIDMKIKTNTLKHKKNFKLSSIKSFKFHFMKRENIDKKVIKKLLKELNSKRHSSQTIAQTLDLLDEIGLPPTEHNGTYYKSLNTSFMLLLFSVKDLKELYEDFIDNNLHEVVKLISNTYNVSDKEELSMLSTYLKNLGRIFSHYSK